MTELKQGDVKTESDAETQPQKSASVTPIKQVEKGGLLNGIINFFTKEGRGGRGNLSSRVGHEVVNVDQNGSNEYED